MLQIKIKFSCVLVVKNKKPIMFWYCFYLYNFVLTMQCGYIFGSKNVLIK